MISRIVTVRRHEFSRNELHSICLQLRLAGVSLPPSLFPVSVASVDADGESDSITVKGDSGIALDDAVPPPSMGLDVLEIAERAFGELPGGVTVTGRDSWNVLEGGHTQEGGGKEEQQRG